MAHRLVLATGSLIWRPSRQRTCRGARALHPVVVAGWRRRWSLPREPAAGRDPTPTVIDAEPDAAAWFNALLIAVPLAEWPALAAREWQYRPVTIGWRRTRQAPCEGGAVCWVSDLPHGTPDWDDAQQERYAAICLRGCREQGPAFLRDFLQTTWVGDDCLAELARRVPRLAAWIDDPPMVARP